MRCEKVKLIIDREYEKVKKVRKKVLFSVLNKLS